MNRRDLFKGGSALAFSGLAAGFLPKLAWGQSLTADLPVSPARQVLTLNAGWRFFEGDIPFPVPVGNSATYDSTKTGAASGAAGAAFDDSEWQVVSLPHDFVSFQPIEAEHNMAQGFRRRGIAWYRNTLRFEESDRGQHIELQLDGIATHAQVWFNGTLVRTSLSGYTSSYIDVTALATYGNALNALDIRVDAQAMEGWWYEGGGMYRPAWVVKRNPVHIITDGIYAFPVKSGSSSDGGSSNKDSGWTIPVEVTLFSNGYASADVDITAELIDASGKVLKTASAKAKVEALERAVATMTLSVDTPKLWSIETPNLYSVRVGVRQGGKLVDEDTIETGFRTTRFDADTGFYLNDKPVKVQGVCIHQDHAGVGVAVPDALIEFRLRRLKELGCNAIRMSHNAPNKTLLRLADRMGFLIMDENRIFNPSPDYMAQLLWMVRRDRNHPSIYLWSVFNEEPMQGNAQGYEIVRRMSRYVKDIDSNRPVTAAISGGMFNPVNVTRAVDVVGFNYQQADYDKFHALNPKVPLMSSEDTSAFMVRGEYVSDREGRHVIASYDDDASSWGGTHRSQWKAIDTRPFIAGGYVWTGFDYHGEPTPLTWPTNSSVFGIMDLCGFDKAAFYMHQSQWVKDKPVLWLIPHWNWKAGDTVRVMSCSNLDEVELYLNGKVISRQPVDKYEMNSWQVPWAPGKLEVYGYKAGKLIMKRAVETAGEAVALKVTPERDTAAGDGVDVLTFRVEALDAKGRFVPQAMHPVTFAVTNGEIIGLGNGDSSSTASEKGNHRNLFNGLAQVIVQTIKGTSGTLSLTATAAGLKTAAAKVAVRAATPPPAQVVSAGVQLVSSFQAAPVAATAPADLMPKTTGKWGRLRTGGLAAPAASDGYVLCVATVTPFQRMQKAGGTLNFGKVKGAAQVFIDGVAVAQKSDSAEAPLTAAMPAKPGPRVVAVVFRVTKDETYGLPDMAWLSA